MANFKIYRPTINSNRVEIKGFQDPKIMEKCIEFEVLRQKNFLDEKEKNPKEIFLDNADFIQLMKISKRTAQTWRDEGKVSFSQVGSKIYYLLSDVEKLLEQHYIKSFSRK